MSKNPNPAGLCACDKCGVVAVSIPDTKHRRCGGAAGKPPLPKHTWSREPGRWAP